jgi:glycosyltransferase involved in cell wall biosynthesis
MSRPASAILHVAAGLGQGGTERAIEVLATAPEAPAPQHVFALDGDGPTGRRLAAAGLPVRWFGADIGAAARAVRELDPAAVILHRAGRPEARWHRLLEALQGLPAPIIEFNVFGWVDRGAIARGLKGSWCISPAALAKYLRLTYGRIPTPTEIAALPIAVAAGFYPVPEEDFVAPGEREALRDELGLPAGVPIAIRTGRPDWRKWSDLLIAHAEAIMASVPDLHLLLIAAPENRLPVLARRLGARAIALPFTTDRARLRRYMAASDFMLHHSRYGESFGYALAEAAALGLPVLAQATPWGDNAQALVVRHGETGFVAADGSSLRFLAELLARDATLRHRLGTAARAHIRRYSVARCWALLTLFLDHVRAGRTGLLDGEAGVEQRLDLAQGVAAFGERFPRLARLAEEATLYRRPWWWRLFAEDALGYVAGRLGAAGRIAPSGHNRPEPRQ